MPFTQSEMIAAQARAALVDNDFERSPGYCQRFVRQVVQAVAGAKYDKYWKDSAHNTMMHLRDSPYVVSGKGFGVKGDLLYWRGGEHGKHGHTAINIGGGRIAHNSTLDRYDDASGHKGTRAIKTMRAPDLVIRLR